MIKGIHGGLDVSRAVFAHILRLPVRTVVGWEQGKSRRPDSAAVVVRLSTFEEVMADPARAHCVVKSL